MTTRTPVRMTGYFDPMPKSSLNQAKILKWVQEQANTFYRSLSLRGSMQSSDYVAGVSGWRINTDGTAEFNEDVDIGGAGTSNAQLFIHNPLQHINLLENDGANYPEDIFIIDANGESGRLFWVDLDGANPTIFYGGININGPNHANAHDVRVRNSTPADVLQFDNSAAAWIFLPAAAEVARITDTAGHNLQGLAWTTWTPTLTNLTVGSGTQSARYVQIGNTVFVQYRFTFGAGSSIAGGVAISVPVTPQSSVITTVGGVEFNDANGNDFVGTVVMNNTSLFPQRVTVSGSDLIRGGISSTTPFTWASGDVLAFTAVYEAA